MVAGNPGDLFALPLPNGQYACGRVLLDVTRQCHRTKLIQPENPLGMFRGCVLVEVYATASAQPAPDRSDVLIPGLFTLARHLQDGSWPCVGCEEVDPTKVEFPEVVVEGRGSTSLLCKGELSFALDRKVVNPGQVKCHAIRHSPAFLGQQCLYLLDRRRQPAAPEPPGAEWMGLRDADLRFRPAERHWIFGILGLDEDEAYYSLSARLGHDLRRFYQSGGTE
jgi:hypothetical protein